MRATNSIFRIADYRERCLAVNPRYSYVVEAPAGSGKTALLTQRFLRLLATVPQPENILALTFTRKAASEMRDRIIGALKEALHTHAPPSALHARRTWYYAKKVLEQDHKLNWELLSNPNRLLIQTIDSFCASITTQLPLLSHFGAEPALLEKASYLYRQAAQRLLNTANTHLPWQIALRQLLLHLDNHYLQLEKLFIALLAMRDQWLTHLLAATDNSEAHLREILEENLQELIIQRLTILHQQFPQEFLNALKTVLPYAVEHHPETEIAFLLQKWLTIYENNSPHFEDLACWQALADFLLTQEGTWRKNITKNQGFPAANSCNKVEKPLAVAAKNQMLTLLKSLDTPHYDAWRKALCDIRLLPNHFYENNEWQIIKALLVLLPVLAAHLEVVFAEEQKIDFIAVTQAALTALNKLEQPNELALRLDEQIQHILVDEFQDTSYSQVRLLELLTSEWTTNDGHTLFIVGDPMQAIYRFRHAEVGLFLQIRNSGIGQLELQNLKLQVNFRAHHDLIKWLNHHHTQIFPQKDELTQGAIAYSPSIALKTTEVSQSVRCQWYKDSKAEANAIVKTIKELRENDLTKTIAILVRARTHLQTILPYLRAAAIPFQAVDLEPLTTRAVIQDLKILTKSLMSVHDRLSWIAVLRAPWCGLTLSDLHAIVQYNPHNTIPENLSELAQITSLSKDGTIRAHLVWAILEKGLKNRGRISLSQCIYTVWHQLKGPNCYEDPLAIQYAQIFLRCIDNYEIAGSILDWENFESALTQLFALPHFTGNNPVQVMTIHKAKGLEFDSVFLPQLQKSPPTRENPLILWSTFLSRKGNTRLLLAPLKGRHQHHHGKLYRYLTYQLEIQDHHELQRLLYVATTRAKQQLYLSGCINREGETLDIKISKHNTLLNLVWPILENGDRILTEPQVDFSTDLILTAQDFQSSNPLLKRLKLEYYDQKIFTPPEE